MESKKVAGEAKSFMLSNGAELTYCERGEENSEIVITGFFYFHTYMPVVEELAKKYHVYGVIMRFDGIADQLNEDGSVHWGKQWGKDIADFAKEMGIEKFIYVGKCHGCIPGWYLVKNHPEMLKCFASFYLVPHVYPVETRGHEWTDIMTSKDLPSLLWKTMRKLKTGAIKKKAEIDALDGKMGGPEVMTYGGYPELLWDSVDEVKETLANMTVPVCYMFSSDDPLFKDLYKDNMYAVLNTRGARAVFLQGEKHLIEIDNPKRLAHEAFCFIEQVEAGYHDEIMNPEKYE